MQQIVVVIEFGWPVIYQNIVADMYGFLPNPHLSLIMQLKAVGCSYVMDCAGVIVEDELLYRH